MGLRKNFQNKDFLAFWLAQLISQFGDRINQMALVGLVAGYKMGSAVELAKLMAFTIIPVFVVGPIAGVFVDRWDRKVTLFVCDIARGLLILLIPLIFIRWHSMWPTYVIVFLAFCLSRFYVPAKMSIIPEIVDESQLHAANSLATVTGMIAFVLGALLGGLIVEYAGAKGGFLCDSVTFFISAALISLISHRRYKMEPKKIVETGREMASAYKVVVHEIVDGIRYIFAHRDILYVINLMMILFMAVGAIYIVIIVFIQGAFGSVTKHLGFLAVGLGIGLFLGSIAYGRYGKKGRHVETIFVCLILGGAMMSLFAFTVFHSRNIWVAQALAGLLGFVVGPIVIAANTVVHLVCSREMQGKIFSALEFVIHLGFLVTMLVSSKVSEFVGTFWILITVSVIFGLVGVWGLFSYRQKKFMTGESI
ncbi:MAG: MFS transporter [Candidatus Omnitrophica bacterium]|nr:MFS transporter [Candidatus Omnitrophota bacterium]